MIRAILRNAGIQPARFWTALRGWRRYARDRALFRAMPGAGDLPWGKEQPMLTEWMESSGSVGPYFLQDQLVARWIHVENPARHVDVGSRLDGFVGSVSVFREIDVIDIRPQPAPVHNVRFHQLDLMEEVPEAWTACTDSLSCLHTIEHFGLGRYADPLDPNGHLKGLARLKKMVKPGGILYLSTPIGPERIEYNAHRVFSPETLIGWFDTDWEILKFAVIDDDNRLHESMDRSRVAENCGCRLGVGIIAARRKPSDP